MANMKKLNNLSSVNFLRHITRDVSNPANIDIDSERSVLNYSLTPRKTNPYTYLKKRLSEIHTINRDDINHMVSWIITLPKEVGEDGEKEFFQSCYDFMEERYGGAKNVISAEVHKDEAGQPHMHFFFVPTVAYKENENMVKVINYLADHPNETNITKIANDLGTSRKTVRRYRYKTKEDIKTEKLSAKEVMNRTEMITFHKDLQAYLNSKGINANVNSGITRENGRNYKVSELKAITEYMVSRDLKVHNDFQN